MSTKTKRIEITRMCELTKGMTQNEIAEKTGISQPSYSKILNNQQKLSADNLLKLADAFNVSADWILGRTDEKSAPTPQHQTTDITYGDIFKVLSSILQKRGMFPIPESFTNIHGKTMTLSNTESLQMNDKIIGSIISVLCRTSNGAKSAYQPWYEDCVEKYSHIAYLGWDSAIQSAYNHYFGSADVSPELLKDFQESLPAIFKELSSENSSAD